MERRDLLLQEGTQSEPNSPVNELQLVEEADEGSAYTIMKDTRGWKYLMSKYITPRNSLDRFLQTSTVKERSEVWGALKELNELLKFIEWRIERGQTAGNQLETLRKEKGRK